MSQFSYKLWIVLLITQRKWYDSATRALFYLGSDDYTVTVVSDPAEGEVVVGSSLTLYCSVQPEAPQGAVYEWSSSVNGISISTIDSTFPNATAVISLRHPSAGHHYCHVYDHGAWIGVGSIAVEVRSEFNNTS